MNNIYITYELIRFSRRGIVCLYWINFQRNKTQGHKLHLENKIIIVYFSIKGCLPSLFEMVRQRVWLFPHEFR